MAQTGYTPISIYYSATATNVPTAGNLVAGELAINTNDGKLFYKDSSGVVQTIASKAGNSGSFTNLAYTGTLTGGTGVVNLGSGQFYKDASGNVGIGTSSPTIKLVTIGEMGTQFSTNDSILKFGNNGTVASISATYGTTGSYVPIQFLTSDTERMRIDSSGNLLVGTTTVRAKISNDFNGSTNNGIALNDTASAASTAYAAFYVNGSAIGSIVRVGSTSAVVYNTTSDQRLKSNIVDANPVLNKLMDVKVRQFDWTDGDLHQDAGFIAQELAPVLSGIVTEGKTEEDMWQLDYSRLTPYLVKAIQELKVTVDAQAARIAALEA